MGFRSRIKNRIKKAVGTESPSPEAVGEKPKVRASAAAEVAPVAMPKPVVKPKAVTPVPQPPVVLDEEERKKQEKVARHLAKTRRGVLQFVVKQGGTAPLAEMHKHSEMRYFIAHQKFSKMMESLVDEGLLTFSQTEGIGTITDAGRDWLET